MRISFILQILVMMSFFCAIEASSLQPKVLYDDNLVDIDHNQNILIQEVTKTTSKKLSSTSSNDHRRRLMGSIREGWNQLKGSINRLSNTPVNKWELRQWLLASLLLTSFLWCCGCLSCNYRRRRHYAGGSSYPPMMGGGTTTTPYERKRNGGGMTDCLRNAVCCFCCYEFFCADCQHVPCFNHSLFHQSANAIGKNDNEGKEETDKKYVQMV